MRQTRNIVMVLAWALTAALVAGCDYGVECDACSDDDDCNQGLTCEQFRVPNGNTHFLCATPTTDSCVVEEYYLTAETDGDEVDQEPAVMSESAAER
jgi:hypothetical protein